MRDPFSEEYFVAHPELMMERHPIHRFPQWHCLAEWSIQLQLLRWLLERARALHIQQIYCNALVPNVR